VLGGRNWEKAEKTRKKISEEDGKVETSIFWPNFDDAGLKQRKIT